jgi:hypothetical protein
MAWFAARLPGATLDEVPGIVDEFLTEHSQECTFVPGVRKRLLARMPPVKRAIDLLLYFAIAPELLEDRCRNKVDLSHLSSIVHLPLAIAA